MVVPSSKCRGKSPRGTTASSPEASARVQRTHCASERVSILTALPAQGGPSQEPEKNLVVATVEPPRLSESSVNISVHNGTSLSREVYSKRFEKEEHLYIIRERKSGRLSRTIILPEGIDISSTLLGFDETMMATIGCVLPARVILLSAHNFTHSAHAGQPYI